MDRFEVVEKRFHEQLTDRTDDLQTLMANNGRAAREGLVALVQKSDALNQKQIEQEQAVQEANRSIKNVVTDSQRHIDEQFNDLKQAQVQAAQNAAENAKVPEDEPQPKGLDSESAEKIGALT